MPLSRCGRKTFLADSEPESRLTSLKVAFIVRRLSEYRALGPVVDRALASGWRVECWHDYTQPRSGSKAYMFPAVEDAPRFRHGCPATRTYASIDELIGWLRRGDVDAVVSIGTPPPEASAQHLPGRRPRWICVQVATDTFVHNALDALERCDLLALHTPFWRQWAAGYYAARAGQSDVSALAVRLARPATYVGSPEIDARRLIDRDEVRRRWGIPPDRPVVVLLPFPQGVGKASFWPKKIFGDSNRARRALNMIAYRQFKYWNRAFHDLSDEHVVRAIRAFCDRQGAFLLVKSRQKTPIPSYTRAVADLCVYDESYYPPTILEALSIASFCISFYSLGVVEAAAASTPNLCITFTAEDYLGGHRDEYVHFERLFTRNPGGLFEFPGVSRTVTPEEAIAELRTRRLSEFAVDAAARASYVRQYIGEDDCRAVARLLEAIERLVASPAAVPAVERS